MIRAAQRFGVTVTFRPDFGRPKQEGTLALPKPEILGSSLDPSRPRQGRAERATRYPICSAVLTHTHAVYWAHLLSIGVAGKKLGRNTDV